MHPYPHIFIRNQWSVAICTQSIEERCYCYYNEVVCWFDSLGGGGGLVCHISACVKVLIVKVLGRMNNNEIMTCSMIDFIAMLLVGKAFKCIAHCFVGKE